jgi:RNA polymerase sigma-70 factor (ECF subfamily)
MSGYACWSDHDLMAAVRDGDDGAFDELVRRYQSPMTGYLYRLLNDYETALDLAQETFVRLYRNAHRYRANHNFSTYLYKIATNLAISELRRRKRWNMLSLVSFFAARDGEGDERPFDLPDPRPLPSGHDRSSTHTPTSATSALEKGHERAHSLRPCGRSPPPARLSAP